MIISINDDTSVYHSTLLKWVKQMHKNGSMDAAYDITAPASCFYNNKKAFNMFFTVISMYTEDTCCIYINLMN